MTASHVPMLMEDFTPWPRELRSMIVISENSDNATLLTILSDASRLIFCMEAAMLESRRQEG